MTANDTPPRAIVVKRGDERPPDTREIHKLARSAGYDVASTVTQKRDEDPAYHLGEGKVEELADVVGRTDSSAVLVDNDLGPFQTFNIGNKLPDGTRVIDRFRLILELFGQQAHTRKAQLQVELAELRFELPRAQAKVSLAKRDERPGFMGLGEYDESRERDIEARIANIQSILDSIEETEKHRREQRRESGFDLVALAGYTNAGKSTLLRRLASDVRIDENEGLHPDLDPTAESRDELFTTLGTTTRKATTDRRDLLVTDTVGFISDLPHLLVESFKSTLDSVYQADLVLLVVDVCEPIEDIREKLVTSHDTLYERNEAPIVTVLNKTDAVDANEVERKRNNLTSLAPDPVAVSARENDNVDALLRRIDAELPAYEHERLMLPMNEETMSVVSWIHDNAVVESVEYGQQASIEFEASHAVVERARAKARTLTEVSA